MRRLFISLLSFSIIASLLTFQSCTDNDYDWDDIDKNGVLPVPPIPIGSLDTIWINTLVEIPTLPPIELPGEGATVCYSYTIDNMFGEDAIDKIFYEGAKDVTIQGLADIVILKPTSKLRIGIKFEVLDEQRKVIDAIKIPDQNEFIYGKDQPISILFGAEYMKYFENAAHLKLNIVLKANTIAIGEKDHILLKQLIAKTGGIHVEL